MKKGSCHNIPCGIPCNCKKICVNCCQGQTTCYRIHLFKEHIITLIKPPNGKFTQTKLFE